MRDYFSISVAPIQIRWTQASKGRRKIEVSAIIM